MFASSFRVVFTLMILSVFSLQVCGFILEPTDQQTSLVEQLQLESQDNEYSCAEMVARIDAEIARVDELLQVAAKDEAPFLQIERESLVDLRLAQPCHNETKDTPEPVVDEMFTEETDGESVSDLNSGYAGSFIGGGGFSGGGGSGGGSGGALFGLAGLAGLTGLDDDGPTRVSM